MTRVLILVSLAFAVARCSSESAAPQRQEGGFTERAEAAGLDFTMKLLSGEQGENFKINFYDHGAGVVVGDIDNDGDEDLFFCNQLGSNALYRNNGDGTFVNVTKESGPVGLADRICVSAAFNDVDNDGDQDLYVTSTRGGNALFQNDGKGRFTDITEKAGVHWVGHTQGATFFDADNDGHLDLFVANTAHWTTEAYNARDRYFEGGRDLRGVIDSEVENNALFHNNGDGTFTNVTDDAGLRGNGWGGDTAVFDYDEDGDLDLFLSNMFGGSVLYQNDGKGRFLNVTESALGKTPWGAVGAKAFDYDGDGRLDLYVVDMHSDMWTPSEYDLSTVEAGKKYDGFFGPMAATMDPGALQRSSEYFRDRTHTRYAAVLFGNALYRNRGDGTFEETSAKAGAETFWPWSVAAGDFDNDGDNDVFLASGMGYPWEYWRNPLLMNRGDGTFEERSADFGIDPPPGGPFLGPTMRGRKATRSSRCAAVGDFDGDGRLDLVVNNFNDGPYLYMNRWKRQNYVAFRLKSTRGARDAVGAIMRLRVGDKTLVRQVHAAGGYLGQSSKMLHFGIGANTAITSCEIRWPSGHIQRVPTPAINQAHKILETAP